VSTPFCHVCPVTARRSGRHVARAWGARDVNRRSWSGAAPRRAIRLQDLSFAGDLPGKQDCYGQVCSVSCLRVVLRDRVTWSGTAHEGPLASKICGDRSPGARRSPDPWVRSKPWGAVPGHEGGRHSSQPQARCSGARRTAECECRQPSHAARARLAAYPSHAVRPASRIPAPRRRSRLAAQPGHADGPS
jgi:hypothetical protein